jgi:CheY-like chemotaxis protein
VSTPTLELDLPRVIFAEDNPDHAFLIRRVLEPICELTYASDGEQLLKLVQDWMGAPPHLVLLDVNLPRISGLEVLKQVRANTAWCCVPVVMFSTSKLASEMQNAAHCGANSFVVKPAVFTEFRQVLESVVHYWTKINAAR